MVGAIATIGDMVAPRERGQYMGYMMAAMMVAMIADPLVGGYITDRLSWRWIFYINMPIGGAALVYLWATLHLPRKRVEHKIDYLGAAVIAIGSTAIVLMTSWGGSQYAWGSWEIVALAVVTVASLAAFFVVEARAVEPMLPLHVFKNRNFSVASSMSFLLGTAMLGALTFLPLYQQTVQHASPTGSGLMLIPLMLGSTATSLISGQVTSRTGRYKILPIIGGAVMTLGIYMLTHLSVNTTRLTSALCFVVLGVGMGFLMQITSLIVQNSVAQKDMGVASSSRAFFQQIGGSLGVSLFGVIFFRRFASVMAAARLPGAHVAGSANLDPATINSLSGPDATRHSTPSATPSSESSGGPSRRRRSSCWRCSSRRSRCAAGLSPGRARRPEPPGAAGAADRGARPAPSPPGRCALRPPRGQQPAHPRPGSGAARPLRAGLNPVVGNSLEDLDRRGTAIRQVVSRGFADLLAGNRVTER